MLGMMNHMKMLPLALKICLQVSLTELMLSKKLNRFAKNSIQKVAIEVK